VRLNVNAVDGLNITNSNAGGSAATVLQIGQTTTIGPYNGMFIANHSSGWSTGVLANTNVITSGTGSLGGLNIVVDGLNAPLRLFTNNGTLTERMRLTAAGRLLLGTTTESTFLLDVNGTARVSGQIRNGSLIFGTNSQGSFLFPYSTQAGVEVSGGLNLTFYNYSTSNAQGAWAFVGEQINATSGANSGIRYGKSFAASSGTATYNAIELVHTISQTGGANGVTRGLYINPLLISPADWRAIEVSAGVSVLAPSTTASATLRIPSGTAPTSPVNGDIWFDGTDLKMRIGGVTKTFTLV
jgi:hypothetical protein